MAHRAPIAIRLMRDWIYLDRAGPGGVAGWIAPRDPLHDRCIRIVAGSVDVEAPLRMDRDLIEGRSFFRFECALPLPNRNLVTLYYGTRARSFFTLHRSDAVAPLRVPAPTQTRARLRAGPLAPGGRSLVVLAPINWSFRRQRSQNLTVALRQHYSRVFFLGPANLELFGESIDIEGVRLPMLGTTRQCNFAERQLSEEEAAAIAAKLKAEAGGDCDVLVQFPAWAPIAAQMSQARIIYDCIDLHGALGHVSNSLDAAEAALVARADVCIATSGPLIEHVRRLGARRTLLAPNAAPTAQMQVRPKRRRNIVIYVGAIETWFDLTLLDALARACPDLRFEVIGQLEIASPKLLPANVNLRGEKPHHIALREMRRARVGIIPFKRDALVEAVNPVKAYEYLAAGLPVVMTPMGGAELADAPGISTATTSADFIAAVRRALDIAPGERLALVRWSEANTWQARAAAIVAALEPR